MEEAQFRFDKIAGRALAEYNLGQHTRTFVRHSDNVTFKVEVSVGGMVGTFSYWVANPNAQELLARKMPEIVRKFIVKFNRGERFWFR